MRGSFERTPQIWEWDGYRGTPVLTAHSASQSVRRTSSSSRHLSLGFRFAVGTQTGRWLRSSSRAHFNRRMRAVHDNGADVLYSPAEVADQLGVHVDTVYRLIKDERLRAVRIGGIPGGALRIRKRDLFSLLYTQDEGWETRGRGR